MAVILFVDIIDSSELSNVLTFEEYDAFVSSFQSVAKDVLAQHLLQNREYGGKSKRRFETSIRGDELCVILYSEVPHEQEERYRRLDVKTALALAIDMKRRWLCSDQNFSRIRDGKSIIDIGIGINCGYVVVGNHWRISSDHVVREECTPEGYAINLAKRIEGYSRSGTYSKIFASRSVFTVLAIDFQIAFSPVSIAAFKGISQPVPIYEIKSFGHVEDTAFAPSLSSTQVEIYEKAVDYNPHELWLILDLAHHCFDKEDYLKAERGYRLALEVDPEFTAAHMYLGRSYYRAFLDEEALPHLERAKDLNPDSARANNFLAVCLRRIGFRLKHGEYPGRTPENEWRSCYTRALDLHRLAMRIAEYDPQRYPWAFNSYAMTLAQAVQEHALWDHEPSLAEKSTVLDEALAKVDSVLNLEQIKQMNLLHHVRGFVLGVRGQVQDADVDFIEAVRSLRSNANVLSKKYREKMAEIYFHRGLLGCHPRIPQYKKALCEAYVGDLVRDGEKKPLLDGAVLKDRRLFLHRQYWFSEVKRDLEANGISLDAALSDCENCLNTGVNCTQMLRCRVPRKSIAHGGKRTRACRRRGKPRA